MLTFVIDLNSGFGKVKYLNDTGETFSGLDSEVPHLPPCTRTAADELRHPPCLLSCFYAR